MEIEVHLCYRSHRPFGPGAQFLSQANKAEVTKAESIVVSNEPGLLHFVFNSTVSRHCEHRTEFVVILRLGSIMELQTAPLWLVWQEWSRVGREDATDVIHA